jgi:hypothetical protein
MSTLSVQSITGVQNFDLANTSPFVNVYATINASYTVVNAAYTVANTALQNTSGTFAGDLSITGNVAFDSINSVRISEPAANVLTISTASTERMRIDNFGSVGIGTISPNTQFEISKSVGQYWNNSTGSFTGRPQALTITNTQTGGYDPVLIYRQTDSVGNIQDAGAIGLVGTSSWTSGNTGTQTSDMYFLVRNSSGSISERMRITSAGNMGIGTASPVTKLHITSNDTGGDLIRLTSNNSFGTSMIFISSSANGRNYRIGSNYVAGVGEFSIYDATAGAERMRISSTGRVGVATPSPRAELDVPGAIATTYTYIAKSGSSLNSYIGKGSGGNENLQLYLHDAADMIFYTNTSERMRIDSSGRVTTPFQPAFQTNSYGPSTPSLTKTVVATSTVFNRGGHYNTSNGRFTAPVAGVYQFWLVVTPQSSTSSPAVWFRINGAATQYAITLAYNTAYNGCASVVALSLNASDYVEGIIEEWNGTTLIIYNASMGGCLLG